MTSEEIRDDIRDFLERHFQLTGSRRPSDEQSLLDSQLIDSLGIVDIVLHLEDAFGIKVEDDDLIPENFDSIASLSRFVEKRL